MMSPASGMLVIIDSGVDDYRRLVAGVVPGAQVLAANPEVGRGQWHLAPASSAPLAFTSDIQQTYEGVFGAALCRLANSFVWPIARE